MSLPEPRPGLVIRYSYLRKHEQDAGLEESEKVRPCAIVAAVKRMGERQRVVVLPITHVRPSSGNDEVEIPAVTKARLGLDTDPSWIVMSELNEFLWPGPGLGRLDNNDSNSVAYGMLPPKLYAHVKKSFVERLRRRRVAYVTRTE